MSLLSEFSKKIVTAGIVFIILICGYLIILSLSEKRNLPLVAVGKVDSGYIEEFVTATGIIQSEKLDIIRTDEEGFIQLIKVQEQEIIEKGQLICILRPLRFSTHTAEFDQALAKSNISELRHDFLANYDNTAQAVEVAENETKAAKEKYEQYKLLYDEGAIPKQQYTEAITVYQKANFAYNSALNNFIKMINRYRILAPFTGTVLDLKIFPGKKVQPGESLLTIADMNNIVVKTKVDEIDVEKVSIGQKVRITSDIFGSQEFEGVVEKISAAPLDNTVFNPGIEVICRIADKNVRVTLGARATTQIIVAQKEGAWLVPASAVSINNDTKYVYTLENETVHYSPIEVGMTNDNIIEVISGLALGQKIVVGGNIELKNGMKVRTE